MIALCKLPLQGDNGNVLRSWEEGNGGSAFPVCVSRLSRITSIAVLEGTGLGGVHYQPLNLPAPAESGVMRRELGSFLQVNSQAHKARAVLVLTGTKSK